MMNIITLTSLALATLYMAVTPAYAHGYVSQPPSRQARCRNERISGCGDAQWEPQSVEAPHGSFECDGNGGKFPELNDESIWQNHFYTVPRGINHLPFTWTLTAPHRTSSFEYFLLGERNTLLVSFNEHNSTPSYEVEHPVPLNHHTGRQTVLARWNIGDTSNSFYSCVDLFIHSSRATEDVDVEQLPMGRPAPCVAWD